MCVFSMYIYMCIYICVYTYIYIHTLDTQTYIVSLYIERLHLINAKPSFFISCVHTIRLPPWRLRCQKMPNLSKPFKDGLYHEKNVTLGMVYCWVFPYLYIYVHRYKIHMHTICKSYIVDICS